MRNGIIISVGYRVKSQRGTQFRIWATKTLREYIDFDTLNEDIGAYLIEDGKEEEQIRELMK